MSWLRRFLARFDRVTERQRAGDVSPLGSVARSLREFEHRRFRKVTLLVRCGFKVWKDTIESSSVISVKLPRSWLKVRRSELLDENERLRKDLELSNRRHEQAEDRVRSLNQQIRELCDDLRTVLTEPSISCTVEPLPECVSKEGVVIGCNHVPQCTIKVEEGFFRNDDGTFDRAVRMFAENERARREPLKETECVVCKTDWRDGKRMCLCGLLHPRLRR